ncbi:hypothetical protein M8J76_000901 [Diaphorina citri]|nr:hypothetical protein M8J76_000901 [Diaphorina citri]
MDLYLLNQISETLSPFCDTKCNIIQLENIFKFLLKLEVEMGSSIVQALKDRIFSVMKEHGSNVSLDQVNSIASSFFSADEFEEIDLDQDASLPHDEETFHIHSNIAEVHDTPDAQLYGSDKCPCVCHTEHRSVKHCFTCAIQFVQGCTYTTRKDKGQSAKSLSETANSS